MSENPVRRVSPLRQADGRSLDPNVQAVIEQSARLVNGGQPVRITVDLPPGLAEAVRAEAFRLTGHKRRGLSDFVAVLIEHGWQAYKAGELEIELQATAVQHRIVACGQRR